MATFEQVGTFRVTQDRRAAMRETHHDGLNKQGGDVVTYFCTPNHRVLHFVVGNVGARRLAAEAKWAKSVHALVSSVDEDLQRDVVREMHRRRYAASPPRNMARSNETWQKEMGSVRNRFITRYKTQIANSEGYYGNAADALAMSRALRSSLLKRDAAGAHLLLAELPLVPLADMEQHIFEQLAGQPFRPRTQRSDILLQIITENHSAGRPTLLMLTDDKGKPISLSAAELFADSEMLLLAPDFSAIALTRTELTALLDDLGQPPPPSIGQRIFPYVLVGAKRGEIFWRSPNATVKELTHLITRVVERARKSNIEREKAAERADDELAYRKFLLAKNLIERNPNAAKERLGEIVQRYPDAEVTRQARVLLAHLE